MLKKIEENIWEVEKEGKMLVPGVIFASDLLMKNIKEDGKTIEQVKNVAQLPGIVEKSIAMPDAHQGYGFPIGGVAAFDLESGIISPGAVGYDINCLIGETSILTEFGNSIRIEEFEESSLEKEIEENGRILKKIIFKEKLQTLNMEKKTQESDKINIFMSRNSNKLYELQLNSGISIKASEDHPFLTRERMKALKDLKISEMVAINTFEGIKSREVISEKEAIIAKIFGYLLGDGCLYKSGKRRYCSAYGNKEDLMKMQEDLVRINVSSKIYERTRHHKIKTKYGTKSFNATNCELHINNKDFLEILENLGMPLGNKTKQNFTVPDWIKNGKKITKRLFLAGFFGAEMSSPKNVSKTAFYCPTINQNKTENLKNEGRKFLIDISLLLEEFNIKTLKISEFEDFHNKEGEKTTTLRLILSGDNENLLRLYRHIGFEYNKKRQNLGNIASLYILIKKKENEKRISLSAKIKEYKNQSFKINEVKRILKSEINERFIERHYYENASQRISLNFPSFQAFCKDKFQELESQGAIFDSVASIKKIEGVHKVYDFNMEKNHNFVANSFIVSNCGVRLLASNLSEEEFMEKRELVLAEIYKSVPSGVGKESSFSLEIKELDNVLEEGVKWAVEKGYATKEDIKKIEDNGCIEGADASKVSQKAKARGRNQLGSLGSGNHFLEIQKVESIFDKETAKTFGIEKKGQIVVMIHSGSRGLGHQTASDYIQAMEKSLGFKNLPDRELACAPINSKIGKDYIAAMNAAANFAFVNRQLITFQIRKSFAKYFPKSSLSLVYDIAHNIAKFEEHKVSGKEQKVCVHRKGATRSFGPGRAEVPSIYRKVGCPIFIPGSMGTFSYILVGTKKAEELSFGSTAHGAGRVLSRTYAINNISPQKVEKELALYGVSIKAGSKRGMVEEAPEAYKDINEVVRVSDELGIGKMVARLKPIAVIKG